jgi:hypothetical protein
MCVHAAPGEAIVTMVTDAGAGSRQRVYRD